MERGVRARLRPADVACLIYGYAQIVAASAFLPIGLINIIDIYAVTRSLEPYWAVMLAASGFLLLFAFFLALGILKRERCYVGLYLCFGVGAATALAVAALTRVYLQAPTTPTYIVFGVQVVYLASLFPVYRFWRAFDTEKTPVGAGSPCPLGPAPRPALPNDYV